MADGPNGMAEEPEIQRKALPTLPGPSGGVIQELVQGLEAALEVAAITGLPCFLRCGIN
jgi:hypothetical protein